MKRVGLLISGVLRIIWTNSWKFFGEIKRFIWDHRQGIQISSTFGSLAFLMIAIWISYGTWQESQRFGSTMVAQMDTLSHLFTKANEQISYLPASVSMFDSTIRKLDEGISNQQQEFQKSIGALQGNINAFSKGIADYGKTLAKVVDASDKQLNLLDMRQKLLEEEMKRSPILKFRVEKCKEDSVGRLRILPKILNDGDEITTNCRIILNVPAEFDFESSGFNVWDSSAVIQAWSYQLETFVPFGYGIMISSKKMEFTIQVQQNITPPYKFVCYLYHDKGVNEDTLVKDPSKCQ